MTLGLQGRCIVYLFKLSHMYTPLVLQVTPRKRVTHKTLEIIYINKWLRFVSKISDSNGWKRATTENIPNYVLNHKRNYRRIRKIIIQRKMTYTDVRWRRNHAINAWPLGSRDIIDQRKCLRKFIYTCVFARFSQSWGIPDLAAKHDRGHTKRV